MSFDEILDLTAGVYFYVVQYNRTRTTQLANMNFDDICDLTAEVRFHFV